MNPTLLVYTSSSELSTKTPKKLNHAATYSCTQSNSLCKASDGPIIWGPRWHHRTPKQTLETNYYYFWILIPSTCCVSPAPLAGRRVWRRRLPRRWYRAWGRAHHVPRPRARSWWTRPWARWTRSTWRQTPRHAPTAYRSPEAERFFIFTQYARTAVDLASGIFCLPWSSDRLRTTNILDYW